jgi:hypothetical protein
MSALVIIPVVVTVSSSALGIMIVPHVRMIGVIAMMPSIVSVGSAIASTRHDLVVSESTLDSELLTLSGISVLHSGVGVAHLVVLAVHESGVGVALHTTGDLIDTGRHVGRLVA